MLPICLLYTSPAGEHFLLLGARCAYRENGPDPNAWIVSRDGAVLSRFCLGDGIQDRVVKKDGTIITSYFDEGVFGNYGWDEPLGDCGPVSSTHLDVYKRQIFTRMMR